MPRRHRSNPCSQINIQLRIAHRIEATGLADEVQQAPLTTDQIAKTARHGRHSDKALYRAKAVLHFLKRQAPRSEALVVLGASFDSA